MGKRKRSSVRIIVREQASAYYKTRKTRDAFRQTTYKCFDRKKLKNIKMHGRG